MRRLPIAFAPRVLATSLVAFAALPAGAQRIAFEAADCLPVEGNLAVRATVAAAADERVRLHFRRLHPAGAFYWLEMEPEPEGVFRAVVPRPERRRPVEVTDRWWEVLATRDWIVRPRRDREWLEEWLDEREFEPAELFVTVVDAAGRQLARSEVRLVEVREECESELDPIELGQATNQTVGETSQLQAGRPLFHWLCYGIVTRISVSGVPRGDDQCRPCVVARRDASTAAAG